jgi:P4 family phage/plasmid primase-like protien
MSQDMNAALSSISGRNIQMTSIAGRMRASGLDESEIFEGLLNHPDRADLPDSECRAIARSIGSKPAGKAVERPVDGWPDALHEWAAKRGFEVESLRAFEVEFHDELIWVPMYDSDGNITGWSRRLGDNGRFPQGDKAMTNRGGKMGFFRPAKFPDVGLLAIVEGFPNSVAVYNAGHHAVIGTASAEPGAKAWGSLQRLAAGRDVTLFPDSGKAGLGWLQKAGRFLNNAGCTVRFVPAIDQDLDDRLKREALADLLAGAVPWVDRPAIVVEVTVERDELTAEQVETLARLNQTDAKQVSKHDLYRLTDLGNAERFKRQHGDRVIYDPARGWLIWDGRCYKQDVSGKVYRLAHETARSLFKEASQVKDPDMAQKIGAWAIKSQSRDRLKAIVDVAQHLMTVDHSIFDRNAWVLNCLNGTVDLKTGQLHPHRREDFISKLAPVDYDPKATHPVFEMVISTAMPDEEVRRYAQKLHGITLIGEQVDDLLILMHGPGNSAKTTVAEPYKRLMGDYSATVEPESLMMNKTNAGGGARGDIARLDGARQALTTEVEDGAKFAVGLLKRFSGGDTITARKLYKDDFEFIPKFTLWVVSNHRPKADSADDAFWRRVRVLLFDQVIPFEKRDPKVKLTMMNDPLCLSAFLRWAVDGVRLYLEEGLKTPAGVMAAITDYRDSQDPLKDFLDLVCIIGPQERVDNSSLRKAYLNFCAEEGIRYPLGPKHFSERLLTMGFRPFRTRMARGWEGLGLSSVTDVTDVTLGSKTFSREDSQEKVMKSPVTSVTRVTETQNQEELSCDDLPF